MKLIMKLLWLVVSMLASAIGALFAIPALKNLSSDAGISTWGLNLIFGVAMMFFGVGVMVAIDDKPRRLKRIDRQH